MKVHTFRSKYAYHQNENSGPEVVVADHLPIQIQEATGLQNPVEVVKEVKVKIGEVKALKEQLQMMKIPKAKMNGII